MAHEGGLDSKDKSNGEKWIRKYPDILPSTPVRNRMSVIARHADVSMAGDSVSGVNFFSLDIKESVMSPMCPPRGGRKRNPIERPQSMKIHVLSAQMFVAALLMMASSCSEKKPSAGGEVKEAVNDALDRRSGEEVKDAAEEVKDAAEDAGEAVKDATGEVKDAVKDATN